MTPYPSRMLRVGSDGARQKGQKANLCATYRIQHEVNERIMRARTTVGIGLAWILIGCGAAPARTLAVAPSVGVEKLPELTPAQWLARARKQFQSSDYARAEQSFQRALRAESQAAAELGLAQLYLITGRYTQALNAADRAAGHDPDYKLLATEIVAQALRRQGELEQALERLGRVSHLPEARSVRLLVGEILIEQGKRAEAEAPLMTLIEDYNEDRIDPQSGAELALVGRAAHLLRSPTDANDAFNEAEQAQEGVTRTLLWRAELFLEKYDPEHAEEVLLEVLNKAPKHPLANVLLAQVRLDQALDFDEAERLAKKALGVNPKLAEAYFVLAGIALRDMELSRADQHVSQGLRHNPRDLKLLSMRAAVRFLADDAAGFEAAKQAVLSLNPGYSKLYQIIGEFADWEHRYEEIVAMMRAAVQLDSEDAKAHAQLGLNLIRAGEDEAGLSSLRTAFQMDPFNVRVYNTLNLYEETIAKHYVSVDHGRFRIRYHKKEKELLERYVPQLLNAAWEKMVDAYGFEPSAPIGVELYADRESFSIRTSGLPHTAIQGVCFGKTLASMSLAEEKFNLGMTLWHELAHVFHIQLSKNHVPRWFTEGLAEYETLSQRPEWSREQDPSLYAAFRSGRLPKVGAMSRAFTRAEQMSDIATAYYASTQILKYVVDRHGFQKLPEMLKLWGAGKRTPEVVQTALGVSTAVLDTNFRKQLEQSLSRYQKQFVPMQRTGPFDVARVEALVHSKNPEKLTRYGLALLRRGRGAPALRRLDQALAVKPNYPDALFWKAYIHVEQDKSKLALPLLSTLVKQHDGYEVQLLLSRVWKSQDQTAKFKQALDKARAFDPTQSEPLIGLFELAKQTGDVDAQIAALKQMASLEEHQGMIHRRLLKLLIEHEKYEQAAELGEAALYADLSSLQTHVLFARALEKTKRLDRAVFELESAALCEGRPKEKGEVYARLAELEIARGQRAKAKAHAKRARELDPTNERLTRLGL